MNTTVGAKEIAGVFKICVIVGAVACLFIAFYFVLKIMLWGLVGVGLACLLIPSINFLFLRFKIPRPVGVLLVLTFSAVLFLGSLYLSGAFIVAQAKSLSSTLPEVFTRLSEEAESLKQAYPILDETINGVMNFSWVKSFLGQVVQGFKGGASIITGSLLAFAVGVYSAVDAERYYSGWLQFFPVRHRSEVDRISRKCSKVIRAWFVAQLLDMLIVGLLTALGLWIIGVDFWAVFGLLTGLLVIFPYVGIILAVICSAIVIGVVQPDKLWGLIIVYIITQQIEGNIILPIVMKKRMELPEAPLIFFLVVMAIWFGMLGVFIAPPLFAILRTIYLEVRREDNGSSVKPLPL